MRAIADRSRVLAVLGPTNTGKTHLAIERMLGHASGMIGFPLRLLARENYDRVAKLKGRTRVALVTGEEKILPPNAQYFICTVESMPLDRPVEFLAVDEIQLCADPERGHVFTHRLLHARGLEETMLLGAETIRPLLRQLIPEAEFLSRPRLSRLTYIGPGKLSRLPPRSAIVAFSAAEVYETAEMLRRHRGGTAVVLGALSPRTRNAQVAMYQDGEVDYLVATDAIGMGLNMDIDHVAFARLSKFDGRYPRPLRAQEVAQIAGRAGRHMNDGTFGTTAEAGMLDEDIVAAVESHEFPALKTLMWRNADLDFRSPDGLLKSLDRRPPAPQLRRAPEAEDQEALAALIRDPEVVARAGDPGAVRLLWEVCQIPDFRKMLTDAHTRLLAQIFRQLRDRFGRLDPDWVAGQLVRLDRSDGDIDTLIARISHTRTWTYISHRGDWLDDAGHWQARARAIEDRLSDALHDRLTQRFVDRRAAMLAKGLKGGALAGALTRSGEVVVEGAYVGRLDGFRFRPDAAAHAEDARALLAAARRILRREIGDRVRRLEASGDDTVAWADDGALLWEGTEVARLVPGPAPLRPAVRADDSDLLEPEGRERIARRLQGWVDRRIADGLGPLVGLGAVTGVSGPVRGILFQLSESYGSLPRGDLEPLIANLARPDRKLLGRLGIRIGVAHVFLPALLKPAAMAVRARLWAVAQGRALPPLPVPGAQSVPVREDPPAGFYAAIGFAVAGGRAVRLDRLEALASAAAEAAKAGPLPATARLSALVGCPVADLPPVLGLLDYRAEPAADGTVLYRRRKRRPHAPAQMRGRAAGPADDSPFAKLRALGGGG